MSKPSPNQPRPKPLATLDALIARAEEVADPHRRAVERLARLRESRRALVKGDAWDALAEVARRRRGRWKAPGDTGEPQ